jgi:hypothetical protein
MAYPIIPSWSFFILILGIIGDFFEVLGLDSSFDPNVCYGAARAKMGGLSSSLFSSILISYLTLAMFIAPSSR